MYREASVEVCAEEMAAGVDGVSVGSDAGVVTVLGSGYEW